MDIEPQAIRDRAYAARISVNELLKRAKVSNSTIWRWQQDGNYKPHPITVAKIMEALVAAEQDRAA